jgi:uncharacterized repeat protein (TIGR01451 family)
MVVKAALPCRRSEKHGMSNPHRLRRAVAPWLVVAALASTVTVAVLTAVDGPRDAAAVGPTITATFYVPLFEDNAYLALDAVDQGATGSIGANLSSTVSITVSAPNTVIYYDQWESGSNGNTAPTYDPIPNAPAVGNSTLVFGDGDLANGNAATYCQPAPCGTNDLLNVGNVLRLNNSSPSSIVPGPLANPRTAGTVKFDGRDRISATDPIAVTHATWPTSVDALHSEMAAAFDTSRWGVNFIAPVGTNTANEGSGVLNFSYAAMEIMARTAGTVVWIDANNDNDYLDANDANGVTIGEGEFVYRTNIAQGAKAVASTPVQAFMMTGRLGSNYEDRSYQVFPTEGLVNDYTVPASTARSDGTNEYATVLYIHNPQTSLINVTVQTSAGSTVYPVAAGTTLTPAPWLTTGQTARVRSTATFAVFAGSGTRQPPSGPQGTNISQDYDWGFSPVPARLLLDSVYVGWAPGSQTLANPDNDAVWVTSNLATTVYVDYDSNPATGTFTDPNGGQYDVAYPVAALTQLKVTDPTDNDMTGAHVYTVDGVGIATAYGEDPKVGNAKASPGIDLGTTMFPACGAMCTAKTAELAIDLDGDGHIDPGDTIQWTTKASNTGYYNIVNPVLTDVLPTGLTYVPGTATIVVNGGLAAPVYDDVAPASLFPFDESGRQIAANIPVDGSITIRYQTTVDLAYSGSRICNRAIITASRDNTVPPTPANGASTACVPVDGLRLTKTSSATGPLVAGQTLSYELTVTNTTSSPLSNVVVTDVLPPGLTWVSTTASVPATATLTYPPDFTMFDDFNTANTWVGSTSSWAGTTALTPWSANTWTEIEAAADPDLPTTGLLQKESGGASNAARFRPNSKVDDQISRLAGDLSDYSSVSLTASVRCSAVEEVNAVLAEVRPNASAAWATVPGAQFGSCPTTSAAYTTATFPLSAGQWGDATEIRFRVAVAFVDSGTANDTIYIDDVRLNLTGSPRVGVTLTNALAALQLATITITTTVTNPFTGPDELTNYAMARSGNQVVAAKVTDCARCFDYGDDPATFEVGAGGTDPGRATKTSLRRTYGDTFQTGNLAGSTGSNDWGASSWTELDSGGVGIDTGNVRVVVDGSERSARIGNGAAAPATTNALTRLVGSLTGFSSALINVTYRCSSLEANDVVLMQVSADGNAPWTTLQTFTNCNGTTYSNQITELPTGTLGSATTVRFIVNNAFEADDSLFISDVQITAVADNNLPGPRLGVNADREMGGAGGTAPVSATSPNAPLGDDGAGADDEDGVTLTPVNGQTMQIPIVVSDDTGGGSYVNGWFDWNKDGDFDADESIFNSFLFVSATGGLTVVNGVGQVPGPGPYTVTVTVPPLDLNGSGYQIGQSVYSRFRVATQLSGVQLPTGVSADGEVEDYSTTLSTLPVDLSYFASKRSGGSVAVEWRTAQEVDNLGFNLYAEAADGSLVQLNERIVASQAPTSVTAQEYELTVSTASRVLWLEDVALDGTTERHGPYKVGQHFGDSEPPKPIDWAANHAAINRVSGPQEEARRKAALKASRGRQGGQPTISGPVAQLAVVDSGVQQVTYEQLLAAGVDLADVKSANLAVTDRSGPVPIEVTGPAKFGAGSVIRFIGDPIDTLYTGTNVYWVHVDKTLARRIAAGSAVGAATTPVATYSATVVRDDNHGYSVAAPGDDPWYDQVMVAFSDAAGTATTTIDLADVVTDQPATVAVGVWGMTYSPVPNEHHVRLSVNGQVVAEAVFDGLDSTELQATLPAGLLQSGANTFEVTSLADSGVMVDFTAVNDWSVTYRRSTNAVDGRLDLVATGDRIDVTGLDPNGVLAYRVDPDGSVTALPATVAASGLQVAGSTNQARYVFSAATGVRSPNVAPLAAAPNLLSDKADYLMITNGALTDALAPLVAFHKSHGLKVKVVDVADIYRVYSHGVVDAAAIDAYVAEAIQKLKLRWVLLVGADSYDYRDYMGLGSFSLLPSQYGATGSGITFAPLDPAYADWNADGTPDVALGRMPARTPAELTMMINKTIAYAQSMPQRTAVLASDANDGIDYAGLNDGVQAALSGWSVRRSDIDRQGLDAARAELLDAMVDGVGMVFYLGHSSMFEWTDSGLFGTADSTTMASAGRPTAVAQFGCWNTYYVSPYADTLGHALMLSPTGGAAVVMGAASLTSAAGDVSLAGYLSQQLAGGQLTVGEAVLNAKKAVRANTSNSVADIELGWTILGDPALLVGGRA